MHLGVSMACLVVVTALYLVTLGAWGRRYGFHKGQHDPVHRSKALWRLVATLACFIVTWGIVLVNLYLAAAKAGGRTTGDVPSSFMAIIDAIILGDCFSWWPRWRCWRCWRCWRPTDGAGARASAATGAMGGTMYKHTRRSASAGAASSAWHRSCAGLLLRSREQMDRGVRIFASTYNMGSAAKGAVTPGPLESWIPTGFDLYVIVSCAGAWSIGRPIRLDHITRSPCSPTTSLPPIKTKQGVQECLVVEELQDGILKRLGGPGEYVLFPNRVWFPSGEIALLVFARAADVAMGAFEIMGGLFNKVNLGFE